MTIEQRHVTSALRVARKLHRTNGYIREMEVEEVEGYALEALALVHRDRPDLFDGTSAAEVPDAVVAVRVRWGTTNAIYSVLGITKEPGTHSKYFNERGRHLLAERRAYSVERLTSMGWGHPVETADPARIYAARETLDKVRRAFEVLTPSQQRALVEGLEGVTYPDNRASRLAGAFRHDARRSLRRLLAQRGVTTTDSGSRRVRAGMGSTTTS